MPDSAAFGKDYLQKRILAEFSLAAPIGVAVESADDAGITLLAPLGPNANDKGTAFGGSLFSLAALAGWAWVTRYLETHRLAADAVIQESTIRYLTPVHGALRARLAAPAPAQTEHFRRMLERAGRGRILLSADIHQGQSLATHFEGVYAAALRRTGRPSNAAAPGRDI